MGIHQRKGFTSYGVAAAVARLVRAVTRDEKRIFMVSVLAATKYGIGPVVLGLPCVIGGAGVNRQLVLAMSAGEQQMLQHSALILDQAYRSLAVDRTRAGTKRNPELTGTGDTARADAGTIHATGPALHAVRTKKGSRTICPVQNAARHRQTGIVSGRARST